MLITMITTPAFQDIVVVGKIDNEDKECIKKIKKTMSFDEYAGYSPDEQKKYAAIINILKNYKLPDVVIFILYNNITESTDRNTGGGYAGHTERV